MADNFWSMAWEPSARDLVGRVKEQAAAIGDDYLGTPHLLLAAVAVTPITHHGFAVLNPDSVRTAILAVTGPRGPDFVTITPWSQTPRFKLAVESAMRRAFSESRAVSCRDLWYGLLGDPESEAVRVLRHLGVQIEELNRALAESC